MRINDRGPYANDRVIDLSREVASTLGSEGRGLARVRVRYAGRAPMNGDDRHERAYLAAQPWFGGARKGAVARSIPASISVNGDRLTQQFYFLCARRLG